MPSMIAVMPPKLRPTGRDGEKLYPDDLVLEWCDGQARKFKKGEDFQIKPSNFGSWLRRRAIALGLKSTSRVRGDFLYFQVIGNIETGVAR